VCVFGILGGVLTLGGLAYTLLYPPYHWIHASVVYRRGETDNGRESREGRAYAMDTGTYLIMDTMMAYGLYTRYHDLEEFGRGIGSRTGLDPRTWTHLTSWTIVSQDEA
jgi:hypothetical protein